MLPSVANFCKIFQHNVKGTLPCRAVYDLLLPLTQGSDSLLPILGEVRGSIFEVLADLPDGINLVAKTPE